VASFFVAAKPIQKFGFGFVAMDSRSRNPKKVVAPDGFVRPDFAIIQARGLLGLD
jgi:hypothetical protein